MNVSPSRLYLLLDQAVVLSGAYSGSNSHGFWSAEEFHEALKESVARLRAGDITQLQRLRIWFAPTSDWDDLIGRDGMQLANAIYDTVNSLLNP